MKTFILLLLIFTVSCRQNLGTNEGEEFKIFDISPSSITFENINELIMGPKCLDCHQWAVEEVEFDKRIVVGDPENSPLFKQISSGAMPFGGPELTNSEKDLIYNFIKNKIVTVVDTIPPKEEEEEEEEENEQEVEAFAIFEKVKKEILVPNCNFCHIWTDSDAAIRQLFEPGDPDNSILFQVVENESMPQFSLPLSTEEKELIRKMILLQ